ncbi:hypothetical protein JGU71_25075 [Antrihabitans sp. YC3-6]|uniref:Uncharacterized protein n=1 Tax=Antrihabitans stalagmiti TaxID=2799499 RepID=A0A934U683_9NOCA|nr:hypothetical protein [Antrihabitans stalagmiti]MBJ8342167.1 hypothetical protein [Antrihabitans stalagmiti]
MESFDPANELELIERAAAAPYIDYPPTPAWYPTAVGLWVAAMIGTFWWWRENAVLFVGALVLLVAIEVAFVRWISKRHGALPRLGHGTPPPEITRAYQSFFVGLIVVVAAVGLIWWLGGLVAAMVAAFVLVTAGLTLYERSYALAARTVRARWA